MSWILHSAALQESLDLGEPKDTSQVPLPSALPARSEPISLLEEATLSDSCAAWAWHHRFRPWHRINCLHLLSVITARERKAAMPAVLHCSSLTAQDVSVPPDASQKKSNLPQITSVGAADGATSPPGPDKLHQESRTDRSMP